MFWEHLPGEVLTMSYCTLKLDEEKLKYVGLGEENGFDSAYLHSLDWVARKRRSSNVVGLAGKSVINMIWLLLTISDWFIIMIGRGGLLLVVVHHLFAAAPVSVLWVDIK
jgi:hypothetical protein